MYENLQLLYEAVWVIRQRELKPITKDISDGEINKREYKSLPLLMVNCSFNDQIETIERIVMDTLAKVILDKIPSTQVIIYLGTHTYLYTFFLLVITDEREKTPEHEILNKIEDNCEPYVNTCTIVHKSDTFVKSLNEQARFFLKAYTSGKICYLSNDLALPKIIVPRDSDIRSEIETCWKRWGIHGKNFLDTALHAHDEGSHNLAVFLMHQSVEITLCAIIRIVLGYRLNIHNILKLIKMTLLFTDDFINIFDLKEGEGNPLFDLLQNGYSQSRYQDSFNADPELVKELTDRVCKVYITAEGLYEAAMREISRQD